MMVSEDCEFALVIVLRAWREAVKGIMDVFIKKDKNNIGDSTEHTLTNARKK